MTPTPSDIEKARLYRAARRILDDKTHRAHMALVAILSLEVSLDLHGDDGGAA